MPPATAGECIADMETTFSMLSPWQWALVFAVPPAIVALYFLKLKRQPLEVPSTFLWHKSVEDLHVNSIWQRLRHSLLLFLQLLLVALLALALLRPTWQSSKLAGGRYIFLIDNSASSAAVDIEPSRLEEAKKRVAKLIDDMGSGDVAMIVSFSDGAQVVQSFTDNRRDLRRRLAEIKPTDKSTSIAEALRVAGGLANPGKSSFKDDIVQVAEALPARLFIFSDGGFEDVKDFSLGNLEPEYVPLGKDDAVNVAILAFTSQRNEEKPDQLQAFGRVANYGPRDVNVTVSLLVNGELADADELPIKAGEESGVAFPLADVESGRLELHIAVDGEQDVLAIDNVAWAAVNLPRPSKILVVSPGNEPLNLCLSTGRMIELASVTKHEPAYLTTPNYAQAASAGLYDLVIFDRCRPEKPELMPHSNTWFIGSVPPGSAWEQREVASVPAIIDTERAHPLMQLMDLGDVTIAEGTPLGPPPGSTVLMETSAGPMFAIAAREQFEDAVLGFEIDEQPPIGTNWPVRLSFPVFILNVVSYLGGADQTLAAGVRPGQPLVWRGSEAAKTIRVTLPDGKSVEVPRLSQSSITFSQTEKVGIYEIREDGPDPSGWFTVNLFDPVESNVRPNHSLGIGDQKITGATKWEPARSNAWKWVAAMALAVLLLEWYIYNRRVYV